MSAPITNKTRGRRSTASAGWAALRVDLKLRLEEARRDYDRAYNATNPEFQKGFYRGEIGVLEHVLKLMPKRKKALPNE